MVMLKCLSYQYLTVRLLELPFKTFNNLFFCTVNSQFKWFTCIDSSELSVEYTVLNTLKCLHMNAVLSSKLEPLAHQCLWSHLVVYDDTWPSLPECLQNLFVVCCDGKTWRFTKSESRNLANHILVHLSGHKSKQVYSAMILELTKTKVFTLTYCQSNPSIHPSIIYLTLWQPSCFWHFLLKLVCVRETT